MSGLRPAYGPKDGTARFAEVPAPMKRDTITCPIGVLIVAVLLLGQDGNCDAQVPYSFP